MVGCDDLAGERFEIGPVSSTTSVAEVRREVACWKGVEPYQVELAVGLTRILDCLTLQSAGISKEQTVSVVITPALDFGRPVPGAIYREIYGLLDTDHMEHECTAGFYLY